MYILSFISWLHGICFHKSILILMWLNSFIFCFMETSMMGGKTQCWDYPLPCPAGPLWSQRVGVDRGWNMDGMCVSCVSIGCECWGGCWVSHSHRPRTTLPSHVTFAKKTAHGFDLYPHREVSFWGLITFSTIWPRWHHYTPSSELHNSDLQESKLEFFVPFLLGVHCVPNYMGTNSSAISPRRNWGPLVLTEELVMSPWFFQNVLLQN